MWTRAKCPQGSLKDRSRLDEGGRDIDITSMAIRQCSFCPSPFPAFTIAMSKIETKWACGNFEVKLVVVVDAPNPTEKEIALFQAGVRWFGQRNSEVDKILGGFETVDGKSKRKAGFKRNDVPYSAELAAKLKASFESLEYAEGQTLAESVEVGEYVRDVAEAKYDNERAAMLRHEQKGDLEEWLEKVIGFKGDTHGDDGEYHPHALAAIRAYVRALAKAL